jgi:hypothetical protein
VELIAAFGTNVRGTRAGTAIGFPAEKRSKFVRLWITRSRLRGPWKSGHPRGRLQKRFWITADGRSKCPLDGGDPEPELLGDHPEGRPGLTESNQLVTVNVNPRTTDAGSSPPCGGKSGTSPLDQNLPLELGEGADEMNQELPLRARAVEGLGDAHERDAHHVQLGQRVDHVSKTAEESVAPPDEERVELALPGVGHHPVEGGPLLPGTGDPVIDEGVHELPAPALDEGEGLVFLKARVLIETGDTDVPDDLEGAAMIHKGRTLERGSVSTGIDSGERRKS